MPKKGFIGTSALIRFMAEKTMLHIGSQIYDFKKPTYKCGSPMGNHPNMTDKQAMALDRCPKCFPTKKESPKAQEGWL